MKFGLLLQREWLWWINSPALWWSLPPLLFVLTLYPPALIFITELRIRDLEEVWALISNMMMFTINDAVTKYEGMLSLLYGNSSKDEIIQNITQILTKPIEEIWQDVILLFFRFFSTIPLIYILPPLGMRLLQRDIDNGFIIQYLSHRGSLIKFFAAKWILNTLVLVFFQSIAITLYHISMGSLTERPEFFRITDPEWILVWFGLSLGMASSSLWFCWLSFNLSRNGVTEFYNSTLFTVIMWLVMIFLVKTFGHDLNGLSIVSAIIWSSNIFLVILMSYTIKRERFWIH